MAEETVQFYAHSKEGTPPAQWQSLEGHLRNTAELADEMAAEFGCSEWGYLAGLWHDLGKFSTDFQHYIQATGDPEAHIEGSKPAHKEVARSLPVRGRGLKLG